MRIITGKYKGRHFDIPRSFKARPTTDFAKENIFNVLNGYMDLEGTTARGQHRTGPRPPPLHLRLSDEVGLES